MHMTCTQLAYSCPVSVTCECWTSLHSILCLKTQHSMSSSVHVTKRNSNWVSQHMRVLVLVAWSYQIVNYSSSVTKKQLARAMTHAYGEHSWHQRTLDTPT